VKKVLSSILMIALFFASYAQQHSSGSEYIYSAEQANNPNAVQKTEQNERFTQQWIANNPNGNTGRSVITIPVVVHVVWNTMDSTQNISDAQIQSQIDVLNNDFRKLNADTSIVPAVFQSVMADTEIEFCLAQTAPDGTFTTGINRIETTINQIGNFDSTLWNVEAPLWDTASYLNIYVCEVTDGGWVLGYATQPSNSYDGLDGCVIDYRYFGTIGTATTNPAFNLGRSLTREVARYLNLLPIWGINGGGCSQDDLVADTPDQDGPNYGCNVHPVASCGSNNMFMNYMDYGDDSCVVMFTDGQRLRMQAALNGPRANLMNSNVLTCEPPVSTQKQTMSLNKDLTVYPNPSVDRLTVKIDNAWSGEEVW